MSQPLHAPNGGHPPQQGGTHLCGDRLQQDQSDPDCPRLKKALERAVTAWAKTDEGRDVVESNNDDFNVGDVALYEDELQPFLAKAGIVGFQIECFCDAFPDPTWDYDDLLVSEDGE